MITIIIPVYNCARFLDQCILSVVEQSYKDWECLLVDDGSTDDSGAICEKWSGLDNRILVCHQKNQGVSAARNFGIDNSGGEYLCFLDADDCLEPSFLETMISRADNADLVVSGQLRVATNGTVTANEPQGTTLFGLSKENIGLFLDLERKFLLFAPHEKMYKRNILQVHGIRFPENCSYGEDLMFNFLYLGHVTAISTAAVAEYHYRVHDGTLSFIFRPNQFEEDYSQWRILRVFHEQHDLWNDEVEVYLAQRLWGIVYDGLFLYPKLNAKRGYLSHILSIPEISLLKKREDVFSCARWIKYSITHRLAAVFYLFFKRNGKGV